MYLLEGMEQVRQRVQVAYDQLAPNVRSMAVCPPVLSYVDIPLVENGPRVDLNDIWGREGDAEQLAFRGWVEEIYNRVWESDLRNAMRASFKAGNAIRPTTVALGDLRHIRHDLVHSSGVASADETGKCAVLKWFRPGDHMLLTMGHVLDFLNEMNMLNTAGGFVSDGAAIRWSVFPPMREARERRPSPKIVSLRVTFIGSHDDGTSDHGIHVAFDNGVWCNIPCKHPNDGTALKDRIARMTQTHVNQDGDVQLYDGTILERRGIYVPGISAIFGNEPQDDKPPLPGPWFRIGR